MVGSNSGIRQASRGLGVRDGEGGNDGDTILGLGIPGRTEGIEGEGDGSDTGRSRCWRNHEFKEMVEERLNAGVTQQGFG